MNTEGVNPTAAEIAERDQATIERLIGTGRLAGRQVKGTQWRVWNALEPERGTVDIYLANGRLMRQGKRLDGVRGLRDALRLLGVTFSVGATEAE